MAIGLLLVVASAACHPGAAPADDPTSTQLPATIPGVAGTVGDDVIRYPIDPGLDFFVDQAVDDLAERVDVQTADIEVFNAYLVVWPDSSLGCPQPDQAYLPVLTDGAVIELRVDDVIYRYHTGGSLTTPFLCESPSGDETVVIDTPLGTSPPEDSPDESAPPPGYGD